MEELLIDGLFPYIISFNNYFDYAIMAKTSKLFNDYITEYTNLSEFSQLMVENKLSYGDKFSLFEISCKKGYLDIAQYLYRTEKLNIIFHDKSTFITSCRNGHINVAKWMCSLHSELIESINLICFKAVYKDNHIDVVEWIIELDCLNFTTRNMKEIIIDCCNRGYIDLVQYLYSKWNMEFYLKRIFNQACATGKLDIVQWICTMKSSIGLVNKSFVSSCMNNHLHVAQWLYSLNLINISTIQDVKTKIKAIISKKKSVGHQQVLEWINYIDK